MLLTVTYPVLPKRNSVRASLVMDHFGISHDSNEHVLALDLEIPLQPGDVVLFTGASGSGKSSLLRAVLRQLNADREDSPWRHGGTEQERSAISHQPSASKSPAVATVGSSAQRSSLNPQPSSSLPPSVPPCLRGESHSAAAETLPHAQPSTLNSQRLLDLPTLPLGTQTLVDAIPLPFEEALQLLAMCGLGEAPLLLRTPQELSEGQRYRFSLALAVALKPQWIVADEFTAVLDRTTAKVIAYNVRRIADRYGVGFLLATAQHDIAADLSPDLSVKCDLDGRVTVTRRAEEADRNVCPTDSGSPLPPGEGLGVRDVGPGDVHPRSNTDPGRAGKPVLPPSLNAPPRKKKDLPSLSTATSGSAPPPVATGRTSLGGIIAVTTSG